MKQWKILPIIMFLVLIPLAIPCKQRYDLNEEVIVIDVIHPDGRNAHCNITTYNQTLDLVNASDMTASGLGYSKNLSKLPKGTYSSLIVCNESGNYYEGECKFKVGEEVEMWDVTIGIIMMGLIGMFIYLAIKVKDIFREPMINKAFMMFFFFMALGMAVIALQIGSAIATNAGAPAAVTTLMITNYKVVLWTLMTMMFIIFILGLYYLFTYMRMSSGTVRTRRGGF